MAMQSEMMGPAFREQLEERRRKLVEAVASGGDAEGLGHLLREKVFCEASSPTSTGSAGAPHVPTTSRPWS